MITQRATDIRMVPVSEIKPRPDNRNSHPAEQIDRLAKIIEYQGFRDPLIVSNRSGLLVSGHGRIMAAKKLGLTEVPVTYQDFDSDEQEYAAMVSENSIASWAELDLSGINSDLGDLGPDFDIDLLGLKDFTIDVAEQNENDPDETPEAPAEPKSKLGDVWTLGNHRLLCGDSTSIDAVEKLMNGEKADMVFTDPPYGMNLDTDYSKMGSGTGKSHERVKGDGDDFTPELISTIFAAAPDAQEVFMWGADYYAEHIPNKNHGAWLVWDKRSNPDEIGKMDGQLGSAFELCWSKKKHKRDMVRLSRPTSFWRGDESPVHPTQKPVALIEWFFERYGHPRVLDLFGGSGSTLIACENTGRKCFMSELDPKYCDVILARFAKYSGKDPVRDDGVTWSSLNTVN